jgi:hypothetical protein
MTSLLESADAEPNALIRRLWLVAAIEEIVGRPMTLVGGAAVDWHTGAYLPTDVDIVGSVDDASRTALTAAGFVRNGRHFRWVYPDETFDDVEFPESTLDGDFELIELSDEVSVAVITLSSLIVDRVHQATDGSAVTFDEAVRLVVATAEEADWAQIAIVLTSRSDSDFLGLSPTARGVLEAAEQVSIADEFFPEGASRH